MTIAVIAEGKSDEQFGQEIVDEARPHLEALAALMTRVRQRNMTLTFALSNDAFGRGKIDNLNVTKVVA